MSVSRSLRDLVVPVTLRSFVVGQREPMLHYVPWREPNLDATVSQLCTARQFGEARYKQWCDALKVAPRLHRKQWEFVYILRALEERGKLQPGQRGLGFGCGTEPLPALMASRGCEVVATDADLAQATRDGWTNGQHAASLDDLNRDGLCPEGDFRSRVSFRVMDMNDIPGDVAGRFDFTWSACAFEHLGSIDKGLDFFVNSMRALRPGGVAVHTTEFNLTSDGRTLDKGGTVIFRRRDIERLVRRLADEGFEVAPLNLSPGDEALDRYIDVPPYTQDRHLKLKLSKYATTSIGIVARRL